MTTNPESARALLDRHGLPEDVIDGVLCLHAQELAAAIRAETERLKADGVLEPDKYRPCRDAADQIDPTCNAEQPAAPASVPPPATRAAEVERLREKLEEAEDTAEQLVRNIQTVAREREGYRKAWKEEQQRRVKAEREKPPADRAAILREAAQRLYTALFPAVYDDLGQKAAEGVNRAVSELRRMADEEQPAEHPSLYAQSGINTPGCDCGHDGMGMRWHREPCAWLAGLVAEAREVLAKEDVAAEAQPATEELCRCGHGKDRHAPDVYGNRTCADCPEDGERMWRHAFTPAAPQPAAADNEETRRG